MAVIEWIQFLAGAFLLLFGLVIFVIEMIGVFRFKYVLNRMHAAAMGDTLGIGFSLAGLIVMNGWNFTSLKLFFVIVFLWFASPTSSHLIARLEVTTDEEPEKHYQKLAMQDVKAYGAGQEANCAEKLCEEKKAADSVEKLCEEKKAADSVEKLCEEKERVDSVKKLCEGKKKNVTAGKEA